MAQVFILPVENRLTRFEKATQNEEWSALEAILELSTSFSGQESVSALRKSARKERMTSLIARHARTIPINAITAAT